MGCAGLTQSDAIAQYGTSYASTTVSWGLRDVTGLNNNLSLVHSTWGAVDQPFLRTVPANFTNYLTPVPSGHYESAQGGFDLNPYLPGNQYSPAAPDYSVTFDNDGNAVMQSVVDYTPRMISRTITTTGETYSLDNNGHIAYDSNGFATPTSYGPLETLGQTDHQNAANTEHFIGAQNPGVAPANGWFALFGQFFDHGLDFIGKGSPQKITIALAQNDPLYGMAGADGQPTTSITITRATISGQDANGDPTYINHTSPYIDQRQTYG